MTEEVALQVLRKRDISMNAPPPEWRDPEQLTALTPLTRRMMLDNALSKGDDDPVQVVATVGDRVAGRVNLLLGELRVHGDPVPALWGFDLMVSSEFRGRGLATKIVRCWQNQMDTVVGNAVNVISEPIYPKLGWAMFHTPSCRLVARSRRFVESYLRFSPAAGALAALLDGAQGARRSLSGFWRPERTRGLRADRSGQMSVEFNDMLARQMAPVMAHRSAEWINWMLACPDPDERENFRLYYVRDKGDRVVAYFILSRIRPPLLRDRFRGVTIGAVKDWMVFDQDQADGLSVLLLGLRELLDWGVDALMVALPGFDDASIRILRKFGFSRADFLRTSFYSHPAGPLVGEEYRRQENWWLSWANSDGLFL